MQRASDESGWQTVFDRADLVSRRALPMQLAWDVHTLMPVASHSAVVTFLRQMSVTSMPDSLGHHLQPAQWDLHASLAGGNGRVTVPSIGIVCPLR